MSSKHEQLWKVCRKLDSDFEPYGKRSRNEDVASDCSCGCYFFVPVEGKEGHDWGVCSNQDSPRAGLLTWEHQGCRKFTLAGLEACTEDCAVHAKECDGFCDHDENHNNGCLRGIYTPVEAAPERENNMMVWVVETGSYEESEIVGIHKNFDSVSAYLSKWGLSEGEILDISGEDSQTFGSIAGWICVTLHEVQ